MTLARIPEPIFLQSPWLLCQCLPFGIFLLNSQRSSVEEREIEVSGHLFDTTFKTGYL